MKVQFKIPKPSAKRLEKKRFLVVYAGNGIGNSEEKYAIPEGDSFVEFEHIDMSYENWELYDDGRVYYDFYIEFHNETSTRIEKVKMYLENNLLKDIE